MRTACSLTIFCSIRGEGYVQPLPPDADLPSGWRPLLDTDSPHVDRMTDACENITLHQTSFAGGNTESESVRLIRWSMFYFDVRFPL